MAIAAKMAVIMEMTTLVVEWLLQQSSEDLNDGGSYVKNIVWWYKNVYELMERVKIWTMHVFVENNMQVMLTNWFTAYKALENIYY